MPYERSEFFFDARRRRVTLRRDFGISEIAALGALAAGGIAAASMGGKPKTPPLPATPLKPDLNAPGAQIQAERDAQMLAMTGRAGTVLTPDNRPTSLLASVGAPTYSNKQLGN